MHAPKKPEPEIFELVAEATKTIDSLHAAVHQRASTLRDRPTQDEPKDSIPLWAARAGVSDATLLRIARGQRVKTDTLLKIARAIRIGGEGQILDLENRPLNLKAALERLPNFPLVQAVIQPILSREDYQLRHHDWQGW